MNGDVPTVSPPRPKVEGSYSTSLGGPPALFYPKPASFPARKELDYQIISAPLTGFGAAAVVRGRSAAAAMFLLQCRGGGGGFLISPGPGPVQGVRLADLAEGAWPLPRSARSNIVLKQAEIRKGADTRGVSKVTMERALLGCL